MSYDVIAYSLSNLVASPMDVQSLLADWSIVARSADTSSPLPAADPFPPFCNVVAWQPSPDLPDVALLIRVNDEVALDRLYAQGRICSCMLDIATDYSYSSEDLGNLADSSDPVLMETLTAVRTRYLTYTTAGRNSDSMDLQVDLCGALVALHGGVFEDPQLALIDVIAAA